MPDSEEVYCKALSILYDLEELAKQEGSMLPIAEAREELERWYARQ